MDRLAKWQTYENEVSALIAKIRDLKIQVDFSAKNRALLKTIESLSKIDHSIDSPCGHITVYMFADGSLDDVIIDQEARDRYGNKEIARVILDVINKAENITEQAVKALEKHQKDNP